MGLALLLLGSQSAVKRPIAIWTPAMDTSLRLCLTAEIKKLNRADEIALSQYRSNDKVEGSLAPCLWDTGAGELSTGRLSALYPSLGEEVVVDGVYLSLLLSNKASRP